MEQKKKSNNFIIPATFFTSLYKPQKTVSKESHIKTPVKDAEQKNIEAPIPKEKKLPNLKEITRRPSALSLKSIHQKKEVTTNKNVEENFENHPKTPFSQEQLNDAWKKCYFKLIKTGENSFASVLNSATIKLNPNFEIEVIVVSKFIANQFATNKPKVLKFLREKLNNYGIAITTTIDEKVEKKLVYSPEDKYKRLVEKNPLLAELKNTFGLDL